MLRWCLKKLVHVCFYCFRFKKVTFSVQHFAHFLPSAFPTTGMSLNVRRSSDPSVADIPPGEVMIGQEEPSRRNPARWSTTPGFQKYSVMPNTQGATGTIEQVRKKNNSIDCLNIGNFIHSLAQQKRHQTEFILKA